MKDACFFRIIKFLAANIFLKGKTLLPRFGSVPTFSTMFSVLCSISPGFLNVKIFPSSLLWDIILILITATLLMDIKVTTLHQCPCPSSRLNSNSLPKASSCSTYVQSNVTSTVFTFLCWTSVFLAKSLSVIQQEVATTTHFAVCTNWHTATSHQQTLEEVTILVTDRGTCLLLHSDL